MIYKYELKRSARKSVSVSISNDNRIVVHCPWNMPSEKIEDFLSKKALWIDGVVERNARRLAANDDIIEYRSVFVNGQKLPLIVGEKNEICDSAVYVKKTADIDKVFKARFTEEFVLTVNELAKITRLTPASVTVKGYKGRWGCCDAKNNLVFNYKLFMLPPEIQHYVIIHELCHILCHNHSAAFWKLVSDFEPDFKALRKRLRNYDFLTSLY